MSDGSFRLRRPDHIRSVSVSAKLRIMPLYNAPRYITQCVIDSKGKCALTFRSLMGGHAAQARCYTGVMNTLRTWQVGLILAGALGGAVLAVYLTLDRDAIATSLLGVLGMILGAGLGAALVFNPAEVVTGFIRVLGKLLS